LGTQIRVIVLQSPDTTIRVLWVDVNLHAGSVAGDRSLRVYAAFFSTTAESLRNTHSLLSVSITLTCDPCRDRRSAISRAALRPVTSLTWCLRRSQ
jgi:hypothetical protein